MLPSTQPALIQAVLGQHKLGQRACHTTCHRKTVLCPAPSLHRLNGVTSAQAWTHMHVMAFCFRVNYGMYGNQFVHLSERVARQSGMIILVMPIPCCDICKRVGGESMVGVSAIQRA